MSNCIFVVFALISCRPDSDFDFRTPATHISSEQKAGCQSDARLINYDFNRKIDDKSIALSDGDKPNGKSENGNGKSGKDDEEPKHIRDNGFLVEEAFNQEPGDVQHIFTWVNSWSRRAGTRSRDFVGTYTMELPLGSQKHQFSFTTQYLTAFEKTTGNPANQTGDIGDTLLNYRYQLLSDDDFLWAAPRFTLILPTGDERFGSGNGQLGYQFNLPISRYEEKFDFHFNAGYTFTPEVSLPIVGGANSPFFDLQGYNLGASVYLKHAPNLHSFVELVAFWNDEISDIGNRIRSEQIFVNPGVRYAVCQLDQVEWVIGVSVPVGLTRDSPDIGVFFYMSIEHLFRKKPESDCKERG